MSDPTSFDHLTVEVYEDAAKEWRWRVTADNNRIVADSAEGYDKKSWAEAMARRLFGSDEPYDVTFVTP